MRKLAVLGLVLPILAGCSSPMEVTEFQEDCDGVGVFVNFSGQAENLAKCVTLNSDSAITSDVFAAAEVLTEGTATYGDQIVCRVNNVPPADTEIEVEGNPPHLETCADMPPAFAYWALWIKRSGSENWEYATEGISSLQVSRGDKVGVAFSLAGQTPTPEG